MNDLCQQISEIKPYFNAIQNAVGKAKEPAIRACLQNTTAKKALIYLLDPMKVFHLQEASIRKPLGMAVRCYDCDLFAICDDLASKKALRDVDIARVQGALRLLPHDYADFLEQFLMKEIRLGVTAKTVNKVVGYPAIYDFNCMQANKYFEHPQIVEGHKFAITEKQDGIRCLAVCHKGQEPMLYSRQGQEISGLVDIESELKIASMNYDDGFVQDGELLISNRQSIPSKEQYKRTTKIVRSDDEEKHGVTFNVFDFLPIDDFQRQQSTQPYWTRRMTQDHKFSTYQHVKVVPILFQGSDIDQIIECLNEQRDLGHEGIMINLWDANYVFKRTNNLLKVKVMQDCDLRITGVEEGKGRFAGTLGALIVDYKGHPLGVGSGQSHEQRVMIWADPQKYIGHVARVQYFEETNDKDGKLSIRFPVFLDLCEEGKEVSYN